MVFYRKYRPQKLSELDSEAVRDTLTATLVGKDLPHAFLFSGPKGLGKTSAARIVAKIVNCEKKGIGPCNKCEQCASITNGTNLDILEIDAASNRGIDEIRDLRDKIKLAPLRARKKVYIIDEAHMLTREAFNALLKTLEEPPPHVMFILCTTEPEKLPDTIASRCFTLRFKIAKKEEIARSLSRIIKGEKIAIDKEVIEQIAGLSDGSFRDGAKILEQVKAWAGKKRITKEVFSKANVSSNVSDYCERLKSYLENRKTKEGLGLVAEIVKEGLDINLFLTKLIEELHQELVIKATETVSNGGFTVEELKELLNLLVKAYQETKYAVVPQLPLELVIIEWGVRKEGAEVALAGPADSQLRGTTPRFLLEQLIEKIKPLNHSAAGILRGCKFANFDGKTLIIETEYKFHKERLEEKNIKALLSKTCAEIVGRSINIQIVLKGR